MLILLLPIVEVFRNKNTKSKKDQWLVSKINILVKYMIKYFIISSPKLQSNCKMEILHYVLNALNNSPISRQLIIVWNVWLVFV